MIAGRLNQVKTQVQGELYTGESTDRISGKLSASVNLSFDLFSMSSDQAVRSRCHINIGRELLSIKEKEDRGLIKIVLVWRYIP
jgi:hypothetical protein